MGFHPRALAGYLRDSLINLVSGMGTAKDKLTHNQYAFTPLTAQQLLAAYRGDWVFRKIVDIPPADSTRAWRTWQADADDITALTDLEKQFGIQRKVKQAMIRGRLFGGGAIIIGCDGDQTEPLDPETVRAGDLKFVHVVNRHEIAAQTIIEDVTSPWFGEPEWYERTTANGTFRLHPSRVVRFMGVEMPDRTTMATDGWGDSVLYAINDAVMNAGLVSTSIAQVIAESKIDVVRIPGLTENISNNEYRDMLIERFSLANVAKSTTNTLVLDKEEEWQRIVAAFTGMPDVLRMYLLIACGAADIPATRMLGQSPAGMNATGDSDIRNYYDRLSSDQETEVTPTIERLDDVLVRSALGTKPDGLYYLWNPLWQMTDAEKADIAVKKATVFKADIDANLIPEIVLARARVNQLTEDGTYPGLEQLMQEAEEAGETVEEVLLQKREKAEEMERLRAEQEQAQAEGVEYEQTGGRVVPMRKVKAPGAVQTELRTEDSVPRLNGIRHMEDAAPRTLYIRRDVLNAAEIRKHYADQGYGELLPCNELHVTIAYSKEAVDWSKCTSSTWGEDENGNMRIKPGGMRMTERLGNGGEAVVLLFSCVDLSWRHGDVVRAGASWDHEEYQPHITLGYVSLATLPEAENIEPWRGAIVLGPEIWKEIKTNWTPPPSA